MGRGPPRRPTLSPHSQAIPPARGRAGDEFSAGPSSYRTDDAVRAGRKVGKEHG